MDRGAWWAIVHGVAKSWTWLKWLTHTIPLYAHKHIQCSVCVCVCVCVYLWVCICVGVYMCGCVYMCVCIFVGVYMCVGVYMYLWVCIYMCVCVYPFLEGHLGCILFWIGLSATNTPIVNTNIHPYPLVFYSLKLWRINLIPNSWSKVAV